MSKVQDLVIKLEEQVNAERMVDISTDSEIVKNTNHMFLCTALGILKNKGYLVYGGRTNETDQKGKIKTIRYLCLPDVQHKEIFTQKKQTL